MALTPRLVREFARWRELPTRTVSWTPERVDRLIDVFYDKGPYTNAYAALVAPEDFLRLTSSNRRMEEILEETGDLRPDALSKKGLETPFLHFAPMSKRGRFENRGHEGRHRSTALARAGAKEVPVVLQTGFPTISADDALPIGRMTGDQYVGSGHSARLRNLVAISPQHREAIINLGAANRTRDHITYAALLAALASRMQEQRDKT